jgi:DNA/RNA endonuclease YhcR with UshA esterase domain
MSIPTQPPIMTLARMRARTRAALLAAGALLAGAAACTDEPAPAFEPTGTGTVAGLLFFDADNNGFYNPVAGDSALGGVGVQLRNRGTDRAIARVTTDAAGRFTFTSPVGTNDLFVEGNAAYAARNFVFCGARVTAFVGEQTFAPMPIKLGCVVRINAAKTQAANSSVTVAGIVTAAPGRIRDNNLYLQDPTGGLQLFGVSNALNLQEGDSIEVTGTMSAFSTELQIISPVIAANVKRAVGAPAPAQRTTGQLAAVNTSTSGDVGRLVVVRRATVGTFDGTGGTSGNAPANDGSGPVAVRIALNTISSIGTARFAAGRCYDITGVLSLFNNGPQLLPRMASDVREVACN